MEDIFDGSVKCISKSQKDIPSLYLYAMADVNSQYYIFGGHTFFPKSELGKCSQDLLCYRPGFDEFCVIDDEVSVVSRRSSPTFIFRKSKRHGSSLVLFGGWSQYEFSNQLYEYSLRENIWKELIFLNRPNPVSYHSSLYYEEKDQMIVFGGVEDVNSEGDPEHWKRLNRMYICDFRARNWKRVLNDNVLCSPRGGHTGEWRTKHKFIIIFGRKSLYEFLNDVWQYNMKTKKWTELDCTGDIPEARSSHSSVVVHTGTRKLLYVFGGGVTKKSNGQYNERQGDYFNDLHSLNLKTLMWTKVQLSGSCVPRPTYGQKSGYFFSESDRMITMFVYGGIGHDGSDNQLVHFKLDRIWNQDCRAFEKRMSDVISVCIKNPSELVIQPFMLDMKINFVRKKNNNNDDEIKTKVESSDDLEEEQQQQQQQQQIEEEEESEGEEEEEEDFYIFPYMLDEKMYLVHMNENMMNMTIPEDIDKELFLCILFGMDILPESRLVEYCRIYRFMREMKQLSYCSAYCEKVKQIRRTGLLISLFEAALTTLEDEDSLTGVNFSSALTLEIFISLMYRIKEISGVERYRERLKKMKYLSKLMLMTPGCLRSHPDFAKKDFKRERNFKSVCNSRFNALFETKKWANLTLKWEDKEILVHKEILMVRSQFFLGMFRFPGAESTQKKTVVISSKLFKEIKHLKALIRFLYTSKLDEEEEEKVKELSFDTLFALLKHADMFFQEDLKFAVFKKITLMMERNARVNILELNCRKSGLGSHSGRVNFSNVIPENLFSKNVRLNLKKNVETLPETVIEQFKRYTKRKLEGSLFEKTLIVLFS